MNAIPIKAHDMHTLKGTTDLNDEVINGYMEMVMKRTDTVYIFSSFLWTRIFGQRGRYEYINRFGKNVTLTNYEMLMWPIHDKKWKHWSLVVLEWKRKCWEVWDSCGLEEHHIVRNLKKWLKEDLARKKLKEDNVAGWPVKYVKVNKQRDRHCGVYASQYANVRSRTRDIPDFRDPDMVQARTRMVLELVHQHAMAVGVIRK